MSLVSEQLSKLSPNGGGQQVLARVKSEREQARQVATPINDPDSLASIDAASATRDAERAALEAEHGQLATAGTQFGRGFLDAVTAPGALLAAPIEGAGIAFNSPGLESFGRELGEASSGKSAMEAAAFLFGGGGKSGLTTAERVDRDISEQQKAWPMLSSISHTAGVIAPALLGGAGGATLKGTSMAARLAMGAAEGAAGGAQQAYEKNEALRDVVSSALVGGVLGGGTAGIGEGIHGLFNSKALRAAAREFAEDQNLAAVGVERSSLASVAGDEAGALESKASELAGAIKDYRFQEGPLAGKSIIRALRTPDGLAAGVDQAAKETQVALDSARQEALKAVGNDELFAQFDANAHPDDVAEQVLAANGGDVEGFQTLRQQADSFRELKSLVSNAEPKAASSSIADSLPAIAGVSRLLAGSNPLTAVAHSLLVTVGKKLVQQRSASTMAALANTMVLDTVSTALGHIMPAIEVSAASAAGSAGAGAAVKPSGSRPAQLNPEQKQERYRKQLDDVNEAVTNPDHDKRMSMIDKVGDFPAPFVIAAGADMSAKMAQLHLDMPKPTPNIRGKAYETLSNQQVQLANAMYEATTNPMSVFSDFAAGNVDYDKVQYAWKQYPGLKSAAQAGLSDILQVRLSEKSRAAIPDGMLTQLDNLFGFGGTLQPSLDHAFASRMDQVMQSPEPGPKPQSSGPLKLPGSKPTFTERLSGQR